MKQWRYLEDLAAQSDAGQILSNKDTAKRVHITNEIISIWNRDHRFVRVCSRIIRGHNHMLLDLAVRNGLRRFIRTGSPKLLEAIARCMGIWDALPDPPAGGGPIAVGAGATDGAIAMVGAVRFYGLPVPPSPADAERLRPPIGSNAIIPAPKLPAAPGGR